MKNPIDMTAGEINKALDKLDKRSSANIAKLIEAGRGYELSSETMQLSDPLALEYQAISRERQKYQIEISLRYGPGAPSRLPKGFGPRSKYKI